MHYIVLLLAKKWNNAERTFLKINLQLKLGQLRLCAGLTEMGRRAVCVLANLELRVNVSRDHRL